MALEPFVVETFGSLNARDDPFEVGAPGAVDMVNVDLNTRGRVRTRDGFTRIAAVANTNAQFEGMAVFDLPAQTEQVLVGYDVAGTPTLKAFSSTGTLLDTTTTTIFPGASFPWGDSARGTASSTSYLYLIDGFGLFTRWDGTTFTNPTGMPTGATHLAYLPTSGRLVASTGQSVVNFSDPFAAETWDSNTLNLAPGDGSITKLVTWFDRLYVFKQRQFFVFTNETEDPDGDPIFNYYTVDRFGGYDATAGDEGVYFWDGHSIWVTQGNTPSQVSVPVEPILRGEIAVNGETVDTASLTSHRLSYAAGRLYVSMLMVGGAHRTLVYDPKISGWMFWGLSVSFAGVLGGLSGHPRTYWLSTSGIERFDGVTTDNGAAIAWSYTSGRYALGDVGRPAIAQETSVFGAGEVTVELDSDMYAAQSATLTLGTSPAVTEAWAQIDQEGTWLQFTLSGEGPASVSRLTHLVRDVRSPGVR